MGGRRYLDHELQILRDDLLRLSSLVDQAISRTFRAFAGHDSALAHEVIEADDEIDQLHQKIEHHAEKTLALQQPAARDLRTIIAGLLISNELERMGDHAEGIARTVLRADTVSSDAPRPNLLRMKELTHRMLRDAMDAFVDNDVEKAKATAEIDAQIDMLYQELFEMLISEMSSGKLAVERGTYLLWTGHNLERICDRVTNICERVIYARTGAVDNLNLKLDEDETF
ncbi:MAG: phosphate signaling complex protein PhoU [Anaerolineae bacterium]